MEKDRTWAEISLDNLAHNYRVLRGCLASPRCRLLAAVKADAYGHGALPVARRLEELGADYLAVACLDEAVELRRGGIRAPILILGPTPEALSGAVVEYGLTQAVFTLSQARALSQAAALAGGRAKVHLKVDTGMGRLGVWGAQAQPAAAELAPLCRLPRLEVEGIFSHFSRADGDEGFTMLQLRRFLDVVEALRAGFGLEFEIRHCASSAAVLHYPCTHLDMVRPGIALYGHSPAPGPGEADEPALRPVMTLKSRVAGVKDMPRGAQVSYGGTATLTRDSRVAVLPAGYADGLPRLLSGRMEVLVRGVRAPQLGRICMDMCMVDVTHIPGAGPGDEAVIFGPGLPVEEKAGALGTISYELLCAVSPRVPRVYV